MKKFLLHLIAYGLLALLLSFVVTKAIQYYTIGKLLKSEQIKAWREWKDTIVNLPPSALHAAPFRKETIEAAAEYRKAWLDYRELVTSYTLAPGGKPLKRFSDIFRDASFIPPAEPLQTLTPLTEAFERLVMQPDYLLNADVAGLTGNEDWISSTTLNLAGEPMVNFGRTVTLSKLLAMQTIQLSQAGRHAAAMSKAEMMVRASRIDPWSDLMSLLSAINMHSLGVRSWSYAVTRCQDPALLEETLQQQNRLATELAFLHEGGDYGIQHDAIGGLHWLQRQGWTVASYQGLRSPELTAHYFQESADFLEKSVLPALDQTTASQAQRQMILYRIKADKDWAGIFNPLTLSNIKQSRRGLERHLLISDIMQSSIFVNASNIPENVQVRRLTIYTWMDFLRLQTAGKLYRLREGHEAPSLAALVPKYLPGVLKDPFDKTGKPYRHTRDKLDYSLGPDGLDQQARILYDPTNGTTSAGDLFIK